MKTWCIGAPSAAYVAKMEDVLDVYQRPYNPKRPVVCFDEGGKELRDTPLGTLPMQPGQSAREDYEYERLGKANVFLSAEPLVGRRRVRITQRHTYADTAYELRALVDEEYPEAEVVVPVCDNLGTLSPACLYATFLSVRYLRPRGGAPDQPKDRVALHEDRVALHAGTRFLAQQGRM